MRPVSLWFPRRVRAGEHRNECAGLSRSMAERAGAQDPKDDDGATQAGLSPSQYVPAEAGRLIGVVSAWCLLGMRW